MIKSKETGFIIGVFVLTVVCAGLQLLCNMRMPETGGNSGFVLLGLFSVSVTVVHLFLLRSSKGSPQGFIRTFMALTVVKFFVYLTALAVFMMFTNENKRVIAVEFLLYYAIFTVYEVGMLYKQVSTNKI
jgi:heme/copper-type cytochrome/quinol oxidase subunit 4